MAAAAASPSTVARSAAPTSPPDPVVRDAGAIRHDTVRAMRWTVSGTCKVTGDATAAEATVAGLLSIGGRLTVTRMTVRGTLEVLGGTDVRERADLDGTFHPRGPVHLASARVAGILRTDSDVRVDHDLAIDGALEAASLHVGVLELTGTATVPGEVVASGRIRAGFRGDSSLGPVQAREVSLKGPPPGLVPSLVRKVFGGNAHVEVERIEADRVELEAVNVGLVRSKEIVLGPGAQVTEIEGTIVRQHPTARVGPESRSRPPHGLSR
jgi:cytoskeletal protein CcmA (bactofilin family)